MYCFLYFSSLLTLPIFILILHFRATHKTWCCAHQAQMNTNLGSSSWWNIHLHWHILYRRKLFLHIIIISCFNWLIYTSKLTISIERWLKNIFLKVTFQFKKLHYKYFIRVALNLIKWQTQIPFYRVPKNNVTHHQFFRAKIKFRDSNTKALVTLVQKMMTRRRIKGKIITNLNGYMILFHSRHALALCSHTLESFSWFNYHRSSKKAIFFIYTCTYRDDWKKEQNLLTVWYFYIVFVQKKEFFLIYIFETHYIYIHI